MANIKLIAMDRDTVRRVDDDGHMFVETTPISKANVCPYYGKEIPDNDKLGLDPEKVYQLYRDPEELAKAAPTFAGKPLLLIHTAVSADDHPREVVVGSVGDAVEFKAPYLMAPLNIWDGEAIDLIESKKQRELSSSYRYRADMTAGIADGERYDGRMVDMSANHVALVEAGRAGKDVLVMDSAIKLNTNVRAGTIDGDSKQETTMKKTTLLSRKAIAAHSALMVHLKPKMASDAKIDIDPAFAGITSKNFAASYGNIANAVKTATKGKLAQDADLDLGELVELLEAVQEVVPDDEPAADETPANGTKRDFLKGKLSAEDMKAWDEMDDGAEAMDEKEDDEDKKDEKKADDEKEETVTKKAMDAAISRAVKLAQDAAIRTNREVRDAEEIVRPYVGKLAMAHDSAEGVYRTALSAMGVDTSEFGGLPASALKAVLKAQKVPGTVEVVKTSLAMDSKATSAFNEMFPSYKPVKTL